VTKLNNCPECGKDKVRLEAYADSYYCKVFHSVYCESDECRERWWPQEKMPLSTGGHNTPEQATEAWNTGKVRHNTFTYGGRYTGD